MGRGNRNRDIVLHDYDEEDGLVHAFQEGDFKCFRPGFQRREKRILFPQDARSVFTAYIGDFHLSDDNRNGLV